MRQENSEFRQTQNIPVFIKYFSVKHAVKFPQYLEL